QLATKSYELLPTMLAQMSAGAAAQVIKTASGSTLQVTCSAAGADSWTCTATDETGGTLTMTGSFVTGNTYSFNLLSEFVNFKPDSETTMNGSLRWIATINPNAFSGASAQTLKGSVAKSADQCSYTEDDISGDGACAASSNVCATTSADHIIHFEYIAGDNGFTYTDACGTFTFGANSEMTMDFCSSNPETTGLFSGAINGTFNNEPVNDTYNFQCNWTASAS
ncbi:MAG: hypothetical protein WC690_06930, partial [bacterium]